MDEQNVDLFDPSSFVSSSPLNGKRGVVVEAVVKQTDFGKPQDGLVTVIDIKVAGGDLDKWRRLKSIRCGGLFPATKDPVTGKLTKCEPGKSGAFLCGGAFDKKSNGADLFTALRTSGFPSGLTQGAGVAALLGADITWKCLEKKIGKDTYTYDVPGQYHGHVDAATLSALQATLQQQETVLDGGGSVAAAAAASATPSMTTEEIESILAEAVKATLTEMGAPIPRGQMGIRVAPKLGKVPQQQRGTAVGMLTKDEFYAKIEGVEYDKKEVRLKATAGA